MKDLILHFLGGFLLGFLPTIGGGLFWGLFILPVTAGGGIVREGTQDWIQYKRGKRPYPGYFWQPFPWDTKKWLEATAWAGGAMIGVIGGAFV